MEQKKGEKVYWIVGASSGIGRAMAEQLHDEGEKLILSARRENLLMEISKDWPQDSVLVLPLDITKPDAMKEKVDQAYEKWGRVDVLVNDAGITQRAKVIDTEYEVMRKLVDTNLLGPGWLTHLVLQKMDKAGSGHIVAVGSIAGKLSTPLRANYNSSKRGMADEGIHLNEGIAIAKRLEQEGINVLNISCANYETGNSSIETMSYAEGWRSYFVKAVKDNVSIPIIAVGVIRTPEKAEQMLKEGVQDFIGLGRPLLADPNWVKKAEDILRCICCCSCFKSLSDNAYTMQPVECALNPTCCRELFYNDETIVKDGNGRSIIVIGAGPAGLTAARVLSVRGFSVTLLERDSKSGGQLNIANKPIHKERMNWAIEDLTHLAEKAGVKILYNTEATAEVIASFKPYAVFSAAGGTTGVIHSIPGANGENVMTAAEALTKPLAVTGKEIAVIGSGLTGLETAETMANKGNQVTLVEMLDKIGPGVYGEHYYDILPALNLHGTRLFTSSKLTEIRDGEIVLENKDGARITTKADYVLFATGVRSVKDPAEEARKVCDNVYAVGDADKPGPILSATRKAFAAAFDLH